MGSNALADRLVALWKFNLTPNSNNLHIAPRKHIKWSISTENNLHNLYFPNTHQYPFSLHKHLYSRQFYT